MESLSEKLAQIDQSGLKRFLKIHNELIDFSSNDYLGLARSETFHQTFVERIQQQKKMGSSGSRLLTGNHSETTSLEQTIAQFHDVEDALLFPTGYQANLSLLSSVARKGDTIIIDELCHASIIDSTRLSLATTVKFNHNDLKSLEQQLGQAQGTIFVVTESLYSMDGDMPDLYSMYHLASKFKAHLIVDEAHAIGIYGPKGRGIINKFQLQRKIFARVATYGKAFGYQGGAILGSSTLKDYLVNHARPFIFSTGINLHQVTGLSIAYELIEQADDLRLQLQHNIAYFQQQVLTSSANWITSNSQIQAVIIPGNQQVMDTSKRLKQKGILALPIRKPSVAAGKERIRICLHSFNTETEIDLLIKHII